MPSAPRFTQKPSIQQTPQGDLLMECVLEADPKPVVRWQHGGSPIGTSARVLIALNSVSGNLYKATLTIKEPNAGDGGAYRCTASNQLGDSNANINLNFAGAEERTGTPVQRGPSFVGKPTITPRDGGVLILMECKVKSPSRPVAKWTKDGAPIALGSLYQATTTDLGDGTYLFQLEIRRPTLAEAGQYRCNIRNDTGETNANLTLNFQQQKEREETPSEGGSQRGKSPHRKRHKSKSREGSPRKTMRSRTATPTQELTVAAPATGASLEPTGSGTKRKGEEGLPPAPKERKKERSRSRSPRPTAQPQALMVKKELESQTVQVGDTLKLECEFQCPPSTKVNWLKDGKAIMALSDYLPTFDGRVAKLMVRSMNGEKSGTYKCVATAGQGEAQTSATVKCEGKEKKGKQVKLEEPPKRKIEEAADQVVPEKQRSIRIVEHPSIDERRGTIESIAQSEDGIPASGLQIPPERRRELLRLSGEGGDSASEDESGKRRSKSPSLLRINAPTTPTSPVPLPPEPVTPTRHNDAPPRRSRSQSLASAIQHGLPRSKQEEHPALQPTIVEEVNPPSPLTSSAGEPNGDLDLGRSSAGRNSHRSGTDQGTEHNMGVSFIQVGRRSEAEGFDTRSIQDAATDQLKPSSLKVSESLQRQHKPAKLTLHGGEQNAGQIVRKGENSSFLGVGKVPTRRHSDLLTADYHEARAREREDSSSRASTPSPTRRRSSVHMRRESIGDVLDKPSTPLTPIGPSGTSARIVEIPENVTVVENEMAILKCLVEGNPTPTFAWTKAGREVVSGGRVRYTTDGTIGQVSLIIGKCRPQDEGDYTLTVRNSLGADSVEVKLLVQNADASLDFRAMLRKRDTKGSLYEKSEEERAAREAEEAQRRQSLFPGKRAEQWVEPLPERKTFQQKVDKVAELKCVYSRPNAKVRWYKDRKEVFSGGLKYKIVIDKAVITLLINNPDPDDSGRYTCEANGQPTHSQVTVDEPPMKYVFINPLPNTQEVYRTKQGILTCKLNSGRAPLVWYRGGKPIDEKDSRYLVEKDAAGRFTLTIKQVEDKDQAEWMAKVTNDVVSKVMVYVEEPRDTFVVPLKSQRANEKESASLECDVNDKDIVVEWWHDGKKIVIDGRRYKEEKVGRRRRLTAKMEDHGEYTCTTKDDKTMAQLIVDPLNKFLAQMEDQTVVEKDDVTISCETKDNRTPAMWFRNGKPLTSMPGGKFEHSSRAGSHTLKISKIEMNEADTYEIDVGGLRGSCYITVLEAEKRPQLSWKPQKFECDAGKPKKIEVPFQIKGTRRGDPKPVLLRNGKPVDLNQMKDLVEVVIKGDVAQIIFKNPRKEDTGKWALELHNTGGSAVAPFELWVRDKPKTPNGPLEVTDITAENCKLKWKPADPDEQCPTHGYVVEMQEAPNGPWKRIGTTKGTEFQVRELRENGQYRFRVKAVNEIGESDPLTSEPITARNPYGVPGKPRQMEAADISADSLTLQWKPPESDGGAPVTSYVVERRDKSEKDWREVGKVTAQGDGTHQIVDNKVIEEKEYYYRVRAVNKAGPGDPCDHGKAYKIQAKPAAPAFTSGGIPDLTVRVGETIKYEVPISGEPVPAVSWSVDGKPLKTGGRAKVMTNKGMTTLRVENAVRTDSGRFTITLKNKSGECSASGNVTVISKPSPPKGPLEVSEICAEGATLAWKPPEDDGGLPLEGYIVEAQDADGKGKFVEVGRVPAAGDTKLVLRGLKEKGNYKFRVKAVNKEGESDPLSDEKTHQIKNPWDEPGKPGRPHVTDVDANQVTLEWDPPSKDGGSPIEDYIIEVKDPHSKEWARIADSKTPSATITGLKENQEYQFRVRARNKAGVGQPSEPCERVLTERKYLPAWLDHSAMKNLVVKAGQAARWLVKFGGKPPADASWSKNQQPVEAKGANLQIDTKKNDHTILCIPAALRADRGVYGLRVKNSCGEDAETAELMVLDKPSKPRGPLEVGNVTEEGCELSWRPPEDDGGEPIDHYEVERLDVDTGRWVPCAKVKDCKAEVKGLKKNQSYQFRVKAVNKEGASEPLVSDSAIKAKNPYDEPGKPGAPDIVDWDANRADLQWEPPTNDGGAPITGYVIERKSKHARDWQKCAEVGPSCAATVSGLKEGEEYEFRVRAVNKAGQGEPSDSSQRMLAKARFLAPRIDRNAMQTVTIKVGQNVDFRVPVSGEPPPNCVWTFNDKPIGTDNARIRIANEPYKTNFSLRTATRENAGRYLLTATNDSGTDSHGVEVHVIGKPSAPEGPLAISEVFEDRVTLDWKAPLDDGGCPIEHYEVEKMDLATGRWVPCGRATGAPHITIQNLQPGHEYKFRVKAVNKEGESDPLVTEDSVIAKNPFDVASKMERPTVVDWDKDHVDLEWRPPASDGGAPVEEYIVEQRDSTSGRWTEGARVPASATSATVPGLRHGEEYQFRVIAKNKAGLSEPSDPTDPVIAKPRNLAPHIHREDLEDSSLKVGGQLRFNVHVDGEPAPKISWSFNDGSAVDAEHITIDNKKEHLSVFTLSKAARKLNGSYTITAVNNNGRDAVTVKITVKSRPSTPKGPLVASDVFEDRVTLDWKVPEDDGGEPISHYEVERQDARDGMWVPCGSATEPHLLVEGLNKGSHYKFRVRAVNAEGKSDPLESESAVQAKNPFDRPDKPGVPELVDWDSDHVDLKWAPPTNDGGAPIESYQIEKRTKYGRWEPAGSVAGPEQQGTVGGLTKGEEYEFRVIAVNKGGASEPSDPSKSVVARPRNLAPKIGPVAALKLKAGQSINFDVSVEGEPPPTVQWFYPNGSEVRSGGKVKLENEPYRTKLSIKAADRSHSGSFRIKAVNESGEDAVDVKVTVVGKPSAPKGPLNVSDVHADHVTLDWKPPEDDGGLPIDSYAIEKYDTSAGRWVMAAKVNGNDTQAVVDGLIPGHEYKFRVSAINAEGQSEPLETLQKIVAKEPYDPPGKSGKPVVEDWGKDHADLKWAAPSDDGGSPIQGYIVEAKEKFSPHWKEVASVPADKLEASVDGLKEGESYEFRVIAVNQAGKGAPSDPSDAIVAKDRNVPPRIDRSALGEIRVRAGQAIHLDVPVSGEPPPEILWDFEGRPLESNDRVKINNSVDNRTKFSVKRALRSDTGTFNITATNRSGTDTAPVKVVVLDRPGEPRGPLEIGNVHKTGCQLSWHPPSDDGGAEVTHYVVEKEDVAVGRWVPCGESSSTSFSVTGLTPTHEYKFRVRAVNKYGESEPLEGQKSIVAKDPFERADRPGTPDIVDWDKNWADLKWTPPASDGGAAVEKYVVESKQGNGDWEYAAEVPANKLEARVDMVPGKTYQFRVKAVNKAGESAPSDPSRLLLAKSRRLPPKIDRTMLSDIRIRKGEVLSFNVNVEGEPNPKNQWLLNGTPLSANEHTKIDNSTNNNTKLRTPGAERADSGRYMLVATNEHGKDEAEVNVVVLDVPSTPNGPLDAMDVTKDSASLKWYTPDDDGGSPITHYVVEKQEDNGKWTTCGESPDTALRVSKLNEGHSYKFRVKAVNRQGESKPLAMESSVVARNPWEAPGKPQDLKVVDWDKDHMDLEWKPPISDGGAPIDSYIVEKKTKNGDWTPCTVVSGKENKATADGLTPGETYQFRVRAQNKSGKGEPSDPTEPKVAKPRKQAPKLNLAGLEDIRVRAGQPIHLQVEFEGEPQPTVSWQINEATFSGNERAELVVRENATLISIPTSVRSDTGIYAVQLQNEFGMDSGRCNVTVLDVPGVPLGPLRAAHIHKEGCTLSWLAPADNGGCDITHYVVEKMDTSRGSWQEAGQYPDCQAKITKLTPGKNYLFRVKAVNMIGESKPLEGDSEITAKNMFDVPSAPDAPNVVDWDEHRIDIDWKPPTNDGGAPIQHYVVERREKGSSVWMEVGKTPGKSFSVTGLRKGAEYEFRVTAVNEAGPSEPSAPSASQITRARFLKPRIITELRRHKVRAGLSFTLDVKFMGAPEPTAKWHLHGIGSLAPELIVDVKVGATSIFFPSAKRIESGNYQLNLKNEVGTDEGVFEINIQDHPSPPQGPIQIENITKDACTLSWQPPEDDGGSEITNYVVERRDTRSAAWVPVSQFVSGTSTTVAKLVEGHEYEFRVMAENALGRSDPLLTDHPIVAKDPYGTPGRPGKPEITDHDVDHIDLQWTAPKDDGGNKITHYDVERRDKKSGRWLKVNTSPVYDRNYTDKRVQPNHGYEYRVIAVNKAGQGRPSEPSELAFAKPKNEAPRFELGIDGKEVRVRAGEPIELAIPFAGSPVPEIKWTKDGKELAGVETSNYVTRYYVPSSRRTDAGQCRITATNGVGRAEARVLISVVDKPGPPEGPLTYPSTSRHAITLAWKPPKDDGGVELSGYRIEYQEVGSGIWERIAETTTLLSYAVKGLGQGKEYRFRVFAENIVGLSEPLSGEPVVAKDPFDPPGPPSTPEVTGYDTSMVALKWNPPRDDGGSPITGYVVERFEKRGGGGWAPLRNLGIVRVTSAMVTGLADGETYQFRVCAINAAGQGPPSGSCEPVTCRPFVQPPSPPDRPRVGKVTKSSVELTWNRPASDGGAPIDGYIVEKRKVGDEEWSRCNSKLYKDTRFTVEGLPEKERFEFRVIAVNRAGESDPSKPSDIVVVEDQPGRPILDLSQLKDITVRAGETITFTLPYSAGRAKPTVDVLNAGQAIYEGDRTTVDVQEDKIVFTTVNSKRSDAGPYKVVVQNRFGKDFAKLRVNVLDVPGKPSGPLAFSDISGESITCHWGPPRDDGGAPVTNYVLEKKDPRSGDWERVGQSIGTSFRVRNLINGNKYEFRVRAENQYGVGEPLEGDDAVVAKNLYDPPGPPGQPEAINTTDDSITLQWLRPHNDGGAPILGYVLEKREAGKGNWEKASFTNIPDTRFRVGGLVAQRSYEFRVAAVNVAGQGEWSENSVPIVATSAPSKPLISLGMLGRDLVVMAGEPANILVPFAANPRPEVVWSRNGIPFDERDTRAAIETTDYLTQLSYKKCERGDTGTYTIRMENDLGSDSLDLRFRVVDKPAPPEGPLDVDDIGPESCRLAWKPPKDDGGSPITNYVVEKFRVGVDTWEKCSSFVRNTECLVADLVANERYKFRVFAENQYGLSPPLEMLEPITAKYQFTVPGQPDKPRVTNMDRTWAEVEWDPPASNGGSKILGYELHYRDSHSYKWIVANKALIGDTHFRASNLRDQGEYEFRVAAKNAAGWSKPSPPSDKVQLKQRHGPPGPPLQVHAVSIGPNWVTLTWSPPVETGGSKLTGYVVERREMGSSLWEMASDYNSVPNTEFTVPHLKEFHDYEFRVIAVNVYGRGLPSLPSSPIKIQETAGSKPIIVVKPEDVACPYNKRAVLTCEAVGRPAPTARWLRNGREVPDGARYRVESPQEGVFKLTIKEVWDIDAGEYSCEVSNVFGSEVGTATLRVQAPPVIEKQVPNAVYPDGDLVRIKVYFSGSAPFTHRMTLNGSTVSMDHPNIRMVDFDDHLLITIPELHSQEAGRYEYTISNDSGEATTGFWLNVTGLPAPPEGPLHVTGITEHQATLAWRPPIDDGGSRITNYMLEKRDLTRGGDEWIAVASAVRELSFTAVGLFAQHEYEFRVSACNANGQGPPLLCSNPVLAKLPFERPQPPLGAAIVDMGTDYAVVSWQRPDNDGGGRIRGYLVEKRESGAKGVEFWQKCTQAPSPSTSLNVGNMIEGRRYDFRIAAVNDAGESSYATIDGFEFKPASKGAAPEIVHPLRDQAGSVGSSVRFECEIGGSPRPEVSWFRGSKELVDTSKFTIVDKGVKQVLIVANLHVEDEDEYTCRATNSFGSRSTRAALKLSAKPRLFIPPRYNLGVEVEKSHSVELKIPFKAYPSASVSWTKDDERIEGGAKYSISTDDKCSTLRISSAERGDAGHYRITVHNAVGSAIGLVVVKVADKPSPPCAPTVESALDQAVVLSWKSPEFEGGDFVTGYIVERREASTGTWEKCARSRFTYLTVESLRTKQTYEFRIAAENRHGISDPSEPSAPITIPEPKRKPQVELTEKQKLMANGDARAYKTMMREVNRVLAR